MKDSYCDQSNILENSPLKEYSFSPTGLSPLKTQQRLTETQDPLQEITKVFIPDFSEKSLSQFNQAIKLKHMHI